MKIIKALSVTMLLMWATASFGAVLMSEWDDGGLNKYCKYSNGKIITVKIYRMCPISI